ncbi:hypothetical protein NA57DRAFT_74412 [Rhizodiscina lignyota]|uniref:Transcription factor Iwr1 domain-containing protein n=1 Tax=Rhizodiscina lignyota TaxID=1504668 RepID=A0A9P4IKB4_9PEZI|nr:hypothetical protein NA57DRAFT_74412 [Rhizodiscina lignyota]
MAPQQIRVKRKLQLEDEEARTPEVLFLESTQQSQVFVRVGPEQQASQLKRRRFQPVQDVPVPQDNGSTQAVAPSQITITSATSPTSRPDLQKYVLTQAKKRKGSVATFEAHTEPPNKRQHITGNESIVKSPATERETSPPRKRPGKTSAVPKQRAETWSPQVSSTDTDGALPVPNIAHIAISTGPKFKPRTNVIRLKDRAGDAGVAPNSEQVFSSMLTESEDEQEHGYVYDTYILNDTMEIDISTADPANVGILLIREEDEVVWQEYFGERENDSEDEAQRSDDEDSNAEDFYGADYPEDELELDDEYDVDAYQYRRNASDEEEFGWDDAAEHSGDEDLGAHPWRRHW